MAITYLPQQRLFKLDTAGSTYILGIGEQDYLLSLYYGAKIPDANVTDLAYRERASSFSPNNPRIKDTYSFSPDVAPLEYSGFGVGDFRLDAIRIRNAGGDTATDLRYVSHRIFPGKPTLEGLPSLYLEQESDASTLAIEMLDRTTGAQATLYYTVFEKFSVISRSVQLKNISDQPMEIEKICSASVNLPTMDYTMTHLYGKWSCERNLVQRPLAHGLQSICSRRGSSSHNHNPFVALARTGATEESGEVYCFQLVYSGNFAIDCEVDFYDTTRLNLGINDEGFGWRLAPGETFTAPEAVLVYSDRGMGEMSRIFHRLYRHHLIRGRYKTEKRPLLINSWEAAYFDFNTDKLVSFAERAKELGIEMLVMDDGWFGKRMNDETSLGDWFPCEEKLPGGLGVLIDRVHALGLKFGIWYEPEMISEQSELFRQHPDWYLHAEGRESSIARNQYVIDMTRKDVRDNLFDQMSAVLSRYPIDYLKWDFNRNLTEVHSMQLSAEHQKEVFHRFVLGTYELMGRICQAFPHILLENCSGGGGRFDPAMLYYSPQIWCSDNTDPIERLAIQFGTSYCYPASTMGAHVSMSDRTGWETKSNVALWGTFGYELDPNRLSEQDKAIAKRAIAEYHAYYDLIHTGDLYRLITPFENAFRCAWEIVAEDRSEALLTVVTMRHPINPFFLLRLRGLDPDASYRDEDTGEVYSGALLMNAGINLSRLPATDGSSYKKHFVRV